jgi:hypothetical protein
MKKVHNTSHLMPRLAFVRLTTVCFHVPAVALHEIPHGRYVARLHITGGLQRGADSDWCRIALPITQLSRPDGPLTVHTDWPGCVRLCSTTRTNPHGLPKAEQTVPVGSSCAMHEPAPRAALICAQTRLVGSMLLCWNAGTEALLRRTRAAPQSSDKTPKAEQQSSAVTQPAPRQPVKHQTASINPTSGSSSGVAAVPECRRTNQAAQLSGNKAAETARLITDPH